VKLGVVKIEQFEDQEVVLKDSPCRRGHGYPINFTGVKSTTVKLQVT